MIDKVNHARVLLVDDDPDIVRLLTKVIERATNNEINIESLTDPKEARKRIDRGGIDILITDLEMPGISGLELLRCAKRRNPATQVLFITGHSTQDALLDALELGASDYLLKPIDQIKLLEILQHAFDRQRRWKAALLGTWQAGRTPETVTPADSPQVV